MVIQITNSSVESLCSHADTYTHTHTQAFMRIYFPQSETLCPTTEIKCRITTIPKKNVPTNLTKTMRKSTIVPIRMRRSMYLLVYMHNMSTFGKQLNVKLFDLAHVPLLSLPPSLSLSLYLSVFLSLFLPSIPRRRNFLFTFKIV